MKDTLVRAGEGTAEKREEFRRGFDTVLAEGVTVNGLSVEELAVLWKLGENQVVSDSRRITCFLRARPVCYSG